MHPYLYRNVITPRVEQHPKKYSTSPISFQFIQMFQSRKHHLLTRLFDLACKKNLVQNRVDLVPILSLVSVST